MATPPEPLQPTPQDVLEALRLVLVPQPQLKKLPSALQFFAHLQLLSAQLRSEAIRALKAHKGLMVQLEEHGVVDDQDVMDWGVLTIREGEALEKVAGNKAEFPREDIMMELSLEFRLLHIAMVLSRSKKVQIDKCLPLFNVYFPVIPPPPQYGDSGRDTKDEEAWRNWESTVHRQVHCYNRALTPSQAMRMDLYRRRGEEMIQKARKHASNVDPEKAKMKLDDLLPGRTTESANSCAESIVYLAESVLEDMLTMQSIFEPEKEPSEVAASDQEEREEEEGDDGKGDHEEGEEEECPEGSAAGYEADGYEMDEDTGNGHHAEEASENGDRRLNCNQGPSNRQPKPSLVYDPRRGASYSPPALRSFAPAQSSSTRKPFRGSPQLSTPGPSRLRDDRRDEAMPFTPTFKRVHQTPRRSGLPPLDGPDYTTPRSAHRYTKEDLKPFDSSEVVRSPQTDRIKRSRLSAGFGPVDLEEERRQKRAREESVD